MAYMCITGLLFLLQILMLPVPECRAKVPAIIVFGDSSVDSGNNNFISTIAKGNFAPYGRDFPGGGATGRFCNGRLPPDFLSEAFGLKPTIPAYLDPMYNISDFATGVCFASAGSGYDNATADVLVSIPSKKYFILILRHARFHELIYLLPVIPNCRFCAKFHFLSKNVITIDNYFFLLMVTYILLPMLTLQGVIPLWQELEHYKDYQKILKAYIGAVKAKEIITEALYIMSLGTNDFLENYYAIPARRSQFTIQQYQDFLIGLAENFVKQLFGLGARKLSLTGLSPMGCLPLERATNFMHPNNCVKEYNDLALEFNGKLNSLVAKLNGELPGMKVLFANPYDLLLRLITAPSLYGFENAEVGCCGSGSFEMGILCTRDHPLTCTDANKYIFWDAFHLTDRTNQIVSAYLFKDLKSNFL
ncbi:unnamed protein product [Dovyalis caffra]|uniref:GDSL esterase/lipase n=1 Tax=Dovyalis caffra TaxID=77055 RepID=A0AAV1S6R1_9ROSI|nr:unnamed protein product [Dovyalis caffra]